MSDTLKEITDQGSLHCRKPRKYLGECISDCCTVIVNNLTHYLKIPITIRRLTGKRLETYRVILVFQKWDNPVVLLFYPWHV